MGARTQSEINNLHTEFNYLSTAVLHLKAKLAWYQKKLETTGSVAKGDNFALEQLIQQTKDTMISLVDYLKQVKINCGIPYLQIPDIEDCINPQPQPDNDKDI